MGVRKDIRTALFSLTSVILLVLAACTAQQAASSGSVPGVDQKTTTISGVVTNFTGNAVVIDTAQGTMALEIRTSTGVELPDSSRGAFADLKPGARVDAQVNPSTREAVKIKVTQEASATETPKITQPSVTSSQISGTVTGFTGNTIIIQTTQGTVALEIRTSTGVELPDGSRGSFADLKPGAKVDAQVNPATREAVKIKIVP